MVYKRSVRVHQRHRQSGNLKVWRTDEATSYQRTGVGARDAYTFKTVSKSWAIPRNTKNIDIWPQRYSNFTQMGLSHEMLWSLKDRYFATLDIRLSQLLARSRSKLAYDRIKNCDNLPLKTNIIATLDIRLQNYSSPGPGRQLAKLWNWSRLNFPGSTCKN